MNQRNEESKITLIRIWVYVVYNTATSLIQLTYHF